MKEGLCAAAASPCFELKARPLTSADEAHRVARRKAGTKNAITQANQASRPAGGNTAAPGPLQKWMTYHCYRLMLQWDDTVALLRYTRVCDSAFHQPRWRSRLRSTCTARQDLMNPSPEKPWATPGQRLEVEGRRQYIPRGGPAHRSGVGVNWNWMQHPEGPRKAGYGCCWLGIHVPLSRQILIKCGQIPPRTTADWLKWATARAAIAGRQQTYRPPDHPRPRASRPGDSRVAWAGLAATPVPPRGFLPERIDEQAADASTNDRSIGRLAPSHRAAMGCQPEPPSGPPAILGCAAEIPPAAAALFPLHPAGHRSNTWRASIKQRDRRAFQHSSTH